MRRFATGCATGCYGFALRAKAAPMLNATGCYGITRTCTRARKISSSFAMFPRVYATPPVAPVAVRSYQGFTRSKCYGLPVAALGKSKQ